jgi:hypothetical protein
VASPQTVTLTATAGALSASVTLTVNPAPVMITVNGRVLKEVDGSALAGVPVQLDPGARTTTTDVNGAFVFTGVIAPYDVSAVNPAESAAVVYKGLTRSDPTLWMPTRGAVPPPARSGTIAGVVDPGTGCEGGADPCTSWVGFGAPEASLPGIAAPILGYSLPLEWDGAATIQGTLHLLQSSVNATTLATSYWYGSRSPVSVSDTMTTTENWPPSSVAALPPATLSGTVSAAASYTILGADFYLDLANELALSATSCSGPAAPPCAAGAYVADVPSVSGSTLSGSVFASGPAGEGSFVQRRGGLAGGTGFDLAIQAAPSQTAPPDAATGVTPATAFTWTAFAGGSHQVIYEPDTAANPQYTVYTAGTSTTLPNLTGLSASVALPAGAGYSWSVTGLAPATVDEWASMTPPFPNPYSLGLSPGATFTTQ